MDKLKPPPSGLGDGEPRAGGERAGDERREGRGELVSLTLFVAGATTRSQKAVFNVKRFCEERLADAYELVVVDVYQDPEAARDAQIIVAPTLIRNRPRPPRRYSGDLSDGDFLMVRLELRRCPNEPPNGPPLK